MIQAIAFYLFAVLMIAAGAFTILARNPVHSVLWLILTFFSAAGLFVLLGAEFLAMILVIVYVGAVMVLFLFVVMMLDVDFSRLKAGFVSYLPLGVLISLVLIVELGLVAGHWIFADAAPATRIATTPASADMQNIHALGFIMYDQYVLIFQLAGLILLVAMIGAIVLTLRHREGIKRQDVLTQMYRGRDITLVDVEPGQGV